MDNRYLLRQRQMWFAVVEVPSSLRKALGRRIKRSLQTRDVNVARARRHRVVGEIKELFEETRQGPHGDRRTQERISPPCSS